jgi:hypothetical protein
MDLNDLEQAICGVAAATGGGGGAAAAADFQNFPYT